MRIKSYYKVGGGGGLRTVNSKRLKIRGCGLFEGMHMQTEKKQVSGYLLAYTEALDPRSKDKQSSPFPSL
jgi:hypothetical protein